MNINFTKLTEQVKPRGVIHVGANTCQELPLYLAHGIENRLWVEPNDNLEFPKGETIIHVAISNRVSDRDMMYLASNNGESSSLLEPKKHLELYQEIDFSQKFLITPITTLKNIIDILVMNSTKFNYLVLDIQGNELRALQGLSNFDSHFDVIITEAYTQELYENCGKLHEIEAFLSNYKLVEFAPEIGKGWGDAAFIRKDLL
jgi:FkbM family methyltransferase